MNGLNIRVIGSSFIRSTKVRINAIINADRLIGKWIFCKILNGPKPKFLAVKDSGLDTYQIEDSTNAKVANKFVDIVLVNCEGGDDEKTQCGEQGIQGYPTIILLDSSGKKVEEYTGSRETATIRTYLDGKISKLTT